VEACFAILCWPAAGAEREEWSLSVNKQLMELVLPRLAQRLHREIKRYRAGKLDDAGFSEKFETLLQGQYAWLAERGIPEEHAAVAIHGAVLVLSGPGLRAEAKETGLPLEVIEQRAIGAAAADIAQNYELDERRTASQIASIVAQYAE